MDFYIWINLDLKKLNLILIILDLKKKIWIKNLLKKHIFNNYNFIYFY